MALLTGGKVLAEELGIKIDSLTISDLGQARRVVIDKDSTTIIGGAGSKTAIEGRCNEIRQQIGDTTSEYDREKLKERLAQLAGRVAVIRVGAPSEVAYDLARQLEANARHSTQIPILSSRPASSSRRAF